MANPTHNQFDWGGLEHKAGTFSFTGFLNESLATGVTAGTTRTQGGATLLTAEINRVTTVGTAADSVILPAAVPGLNIYVANAAAANSMNVFPNGSDQINALGASAAFAVAAGKTAVFVSANSGQWHAILSA